jgi:hypothetical protein
MDNQGGQGAPHNMTTSNYGQAQGQPTGMSLQQLQQQQQQLQHMLAQTQQRQQGLQQQGIPQMGMSAQQQQQPQPPQMQQAQMQPPQQQQHVPQGHVSSAPAPQPSNQQMQGLPIRAYLDQTVVPILLDGMYIVWISLSILYFVALVAYSRCSFSACLFSLFQACRNWSKNVPPSPLNSWHPT